MKPICQNCRYRGKLNLKNTGKHLCLHWYSWRYKRPVTKGMTCDKFESVQSTQPEPTS